MSYSPEKIIRELIEQNSVVRIAALGSSNTQRRVMHTHWFDYWELALKHQFGKGSVLCCNMGVGGETSGEILQRFDRDCGLFKPHLAVITCGGNDSYPEHNVSEQEFADNLRELYRRFKLMGTTVFFQTYYGCDLERLGKDYALKLVKFMQIIRDVAAECDCFVQDNFSRWQKLYDSDRTLYRQLMIDNLHVNEHGNAVMGLDWLRTLELNVPELITHECPTGLFAVKVLDLLEQA